MAGELQAKLNQYLERWIAPHPSISEESERSRARLFALLALLAAASGLIVLLLLLSIRYPLNASDFAILPAAAAIIVLSRSRWSRYGMVLGIVVNYLWVIETILNSDNRDYATLLLLMPVVVVSLLFSTRTTFVAALSSTLLALLIGSNENGWTDVLLFTALFIFLISMGIIIATALRERDNRKLILRANELQDNERRFRALFHQSPVPLSEEDFSILYDVIARAEARGVTDVEQYLRDHPEAVEEVFRGLRVIEVNPATLDLYKAPSIPALEAYYEEGFFERNREKLAQSLIALWKGESQYAYEMIGCDMEGNPIDCRVQWVRLSNLLPRYVVSIEDLRPIKAAERQRQELVAERARADMLRRFLGDATHDLLTPITIINTSIYLGLRAKDLEQVHNRLSIIQTQTTHLHRMITDMLTMSRLDDPTTTLHFAIGDPSPQIARIVAEFEPLTQAKQQQIRFEPAQGRFSVRYDEQTMDRALKNLIQNAVKYTPAEGTITVRTGCVENQYMIQVTDTGVGIPPEELKHIFDRFYRVEAHRPIDGGSGLGLAIVKKIVDAHLGQIDVVSPPGGGTTFTIRLPLAH